MKRKAADVTLPTDVQVQVGRAEIEGKRDVDVDAG